LVYLPGGRVHLAAFNMSINMSKRMSKRMSMRMSMTTHAEHRGSMPTTTA
jgi:hypothetical protein